MKLTRRDAIVSLAVGGIGTSGMSLATSYGARSIDFDRSAITEEDMASLVAVADVIYPSDVENVREFVDSYVGRLREPRKRAIAEAARGLDRGARAAYGKPYRDLSATRRETFLREFGVDRVASKQEGTLPERIRYHLVNTLFFALFTSPKGSERLGITNPVGHPGGYESYQREP